MCTGQLTVDFRLLPAQLRTPCHDRIHFRNWSTQLANLIDAEIVFVTKRPAGPLEHLHFRIDANQFVRKRRVQRPCSRTITGHGKLRIHILNHRVVSYADFVTLLFAFFVVLYASSQLDKRQVGRLALAIQVASQELVFESSNTHVPLSNSEVMPFSDVQAVENVQRTADMQRFVQPMKGMLSLSLGSAPLKDIQQELEKALAPEIQNKVVDIKSRKEDLVVSLREMGFYDSGSSTMHASSLGSIDRLAGVLAPRGESMRIEGHTDNVPIHNGHFPPTGNSPSPAPRNL